MVWLDRLTSDEGARLRAIRLRAVLDATDVFNTTFDEYAGWPAERWDAQLAASQVFVAVENGLAVGMIRRTRDARPQFRR